ncbi:MAG: hypothetical protein U0P30_04715 [Vicinamibacterales bacterium]
MDGAIVPATADSADAQAARGGVFIEAKRAAATTAVLPAILKQQAASAQLLPDELVMAGTRNPEHPVRVSWYVADSSGLEYSGAQQAYVGKVSVACVNADDPQDQSALPVAFSPLVTALDCGRGAARPQVTQFRRWYPIQLDQYPSEGAYSVKASHWISKPGASSLAFGAPHFGCAAAAGRRIRHREARGGRDRHRPARSRSITCCWCRRRSPRNQRSSARTASSTELPRTWPCWAT